MAGDKKIGFYGFQASQMPLSLVASRIQKIKSDNHLDMLVVTIHWTGQLENKRPATSAMKAYARKAIDSGADLVIGHHRHVISGLERYKGKYILYDMGNFVTGGAASPYTYAAQIDFEISGDFAESAADGIRIYPLYTTSGAGYKWNGKKYERQSNNWQPVPASDAINYYDKDTSAAVLDANAASNVISIINQYSPTGPDGKFDASTHIGSYADLP
jgi:poly-gamma-glutamate synthesis protein (capsule biosynthesis protein)